MNGRTLGAFCLPMLTPKLVERKAKNAEAKEGKYKASKEKNTRKI